MLLLVVLLLPAGLLLPVLLLHVVAPLPLLLLPAVALLPAGLPLPVLLLPAVVLSPVLLLHVEVLLPAVAVLSALLLHAVARPLRHDFCGMFSASAALPTAPCSGRFKRPRRRSARMLRLPVLLLPAALLLPVQLPSVLLLLEGAVPPVLLLLLPHIQPRLPGPEVRSPLLQRVHLPRPDESDAVFLVRLALLLPDQR